jgi:SAM-dependent methyltransferase
VTADAILQIGSGFRAAKLLFVANEVGLFERLAAGPSSLLSLAEGMGIAPSRLAVLVHALVALGLVEREGDTYRNGPHAATFLSGQTELDLRPALRFWNHLSYPRWTKLEDALRTGQPQGRFGTAEEQRLFSEGVEALSASATQALATSYDFGRHRRVLDLGGGTGSWLIAILRRYGHLQATLFERPGPAAIARQRLAADPATRHVQVVEGDFDQDPIPPGHDAILIANVLHGGPAAHSVASLRRVRASVPVGTRLLLADLWTDPSQTGPLLTLLFGGEFLVYVGDGGVCSEEETDGWLRDSGWRPLDHTPLGGHRWSLWPKQTNRAQRVDRHGRATAHARRIPRSCPILFRAVRPYLISVSQRMRE